MSSKHAATTPQALASLINRIRGHMPSPMGHVPPAPSRAERLVAWAEPGIAAAEGARKDVGLIGQALDRVVPGASKKIQKLTRRAVYEGADRALQAAEEHGPGLVARAKDIVGSLRDRVLDRPPPVVAPPPSPWYHDKPLALAAGLGGAGILGAGALAAHHLLNRDKDSDERDLMEHMARMQAYGPSPLHKISSALDLLADELDAMPVASMVETKVAEDVDVFGSLQDFYRERVGEEMPSALVEKLARDADDETVDALKKLVKSASHERPTPLGEPSEGGSYRAPPETRNDVAKMAWDQFEETLLNYEGA